MGEWWCWTHIFKVSVACEQMPARQTGRQAGRQNPQQTNFAGTKRSNGLFFLKSSCDIASGWNHSKLVVDIKKIDTSIRTGALSSPILCVVIDFFSSYFPILATTTTVTGTPIQLD